MAESFIKRKIKLEPTLGQRLKAAREKTGVTLSQAEIGSKVRAKYLAAMESSNWQFLPGGVYARGFVLAYSKYLGLETKELLRLYEKEAVLFNKKKTVDLSYNKTFKAPRLLVTPKLLAYFALSFSVLLMFAYIVKQVAGFAGSPSLKITSPVNNSILESDSVDLSGTTDSDTLVSVNSENVPVTSDGRFNLNLKLHRGVNVIKVQAVNKARKESSQIYTFEYRPKTASIEEAANGSNF